MKNYLVRFGQTNPANYTGLSPTFSFFQSIFGNSFAVIPPGISELAASIGLYSFGWTSVTFAVAFKIDGGATLSSTDRFVVGILDPVQAVDEKIGTLGDSFGSTSSDPTTLMGFAKRNQEVQEGTATYASSSGSWIVFSRALTAGVTTVPIQLFNHLLTNASGSVAKT